jgi:NAD(P)-dependent dehydrogenase (short-subunit alcohol dehydrogenase family)
MSEQGGQQRVALVTGASSGVGRATSLKLAEAGYRVIGAALEEPALHQFAAEAPHIQVVPLDVTDRPAVDALAASVERQHGGLDVLVCAAGINIKRRRFEEISGDDWRRTMDTNATGAFNLAQACLSMLRARAGLVIIIASVSARWPDASGPAYQASKRAVLGLAHAIGWEEQEHGVRVSAICPGLINTPLLKSRPQPPPAETLAQALVPGDIADICAFLAALPPRVLVPELVVVPSALQRIGKT